jgi:hypothetical protein
LGGFLKPFNHSYFLASLVWGAHSIGALSIAGKAGSHKYNQFLPLTRDRRLCCLSRRIFPSGFAGKFIHGVHAPRAVPRCRCESDSLLPQVP